MTFDGEHDFEDPNAAASAWVVRLGRADVSETDWLEFDAWLWASRENEVAYDAALRLWRELDVNASALRESELAADAFTSRPVALERRRQAAWRPALAAGIAMSLVVGGLLAWTHLPGSETVYATGPGQDRSVSLPDGTRVDLGGASRLTVRFDGHERRVSMDQAEAVFDVAKDPRRPFVIALGDRTVRVVGTQFDVRRRQGRMTVTVSRGVVEVVAKNAAQERVRLTPGQRLDHVEGEAGSSISMVRADEAFAWRRGVLIYHDRPLAEVVADLNAHFARPIVIDDAGVAERRFSGVLVLDNEESVVRRLSELASVSPVSSKDGVRLKPKANDDSLGGGNSRRDLGSPGGLGGARPRHGAGEV
jgi:transmembrane sensor